MDSLIEKKTAEYCTTFVSLSVWEVKSKYNTNVFSLFTDSEAKMKLPVIKDLMKNEDISKDIIMYGCFAHYLSLLEKIIKLQAAMKYVEIQKYFCNCHQPHVWLKKSLNGTCWKSKCMLVKFHKEPL